MAERASGLLNRQSGLAAVLGFGSALPFVFLTGTLGVWIAELGASMAALGMLSWVTLGHGFKLLWAPLVRRHLLAWIAACQLGLAASFAGLALVDPAKAMGTFVLIATLGALFSATQDIAFEAWRIRIASPAAPVEAVMTASQLGARGAGLIGGAAALALSAPLGWSGVAWLMAAISLVLALAAGMLRGAVGAEPALPPARPPGAITPPRLIALACVLACFAAAFAMTTGQALTGVTTAQGAETGAADFTLHRGPLIVFMIAVAPILASQLDARLLASARPALARFARVRVAAPPVVDDLYETLVAPFGDLARRYGWRLGLLFLFVASYSVSWYSWAGFTMPLYITELGYTKNEVAVAARLYGSGVTALGILAGGLALLRLRRIHALLLGALLPVIANAAYADLAAGGPALRGLAGLLGAPATEASPLAVLYLAILIKNLIAGTASAIFAGHLATLVSKRFAAVQCAIISSIVFTIGTLLSALAGEYIDRHGFAALTGAASLVAVFAAVVVLANAATFERAGAD